jgi:hypothetical protein
MRPRTPLLFALVVLLGAAAAVPSALAAPSKVKLEVNQNCVDPEWPCWTAEPSALRPQPDLKFSITEGGEVEFADHDPTTETSVVWTGGPTTPSCPGVPTTTTVSTGWEGTCTFTQPGTYMFKSLNMFNGPKNGLYGDEDYTEYEVVVTGPPTPTAATGQATGVTETEATLNGSVNPEGQATSYYFEYGSTESYGTKTGEVSAGGGGTNQEFHFTWTGLSPNTTYYFQLVAVYGAGKTKVEGGRMTVKTAAPPGAPTASTQQATGVTETEATLKGTVNPDGEATEYFFEYGTDTNYGQKTAKAILQASGGGNQGVAAVLKGLTPGTEYHFRLVAENKHGSEMGLDHSFKTMSPPAKEPTKEPTPTPTPTGGGPTATTSGSPSSGQPTTEPAAGPLLGTLKLASTQHGGVVHGSLVVSSAGAGGDLQIDLLTKGAAAPAGKFLRSSLHGGKLTFALMLSARAKHTLKAHHRLALTVKIVLTPARGSAVTITRSVVLHA